MSFQLTIQLPPGQCWKVIKQTDTKSRVRIPQHGKVEPSDVCAVVCSRNNPQEKKWKYCIGNIHTQPKKRAVLHPRLHRFFNI